MSTEGSPIFVVSHQRSGTHLVIDFLRRHFASCSLFRLPWQSLSRHYLDADLLARQPAIEQEKASFGRRLKSVAHPVIKTHDLPGFPEAKACRDYLNQVLEMARRVYVLRDPRQVMASWRLWKGQSHQAEAEFSDFLREPVTSDGLSRVGFWKKHVESWTAMAGGLVVRYEDVVKRPLDMVTRFADYLELAPRPQSRPLPPKMTSLWRLRWHQLTRLEAETTTILSEGMLQGRQRLRWPELATPEDESYLQNLCGPLLERFGYRQPAEAQA